MPSVHAFIVGCLPLLALAASPLSAPSTSLGDLVNMTCTGAVCNVFARAGGGVVPLRLQYYAPQIVRWWLAVDGNWSRNGAADDVIVGGAASVNVSLVDGGAYYEVSPLNNPMVVARVQKSPVLLTLLVGGQVVVSESAPLSWNADTSWQTLSRDKAPLAPGLSVEYFYGAGMQNGHWSHRDTVVQLGVDYNWDINGHPNSVPWYMSSAGYGVLRNTWAPGQYSFGSPVVTIHNETDRFDAFFLLAGPGPSSFKTLLGLYTQLTGPPFLPPLYGLFLGDSDCYHNDRHSNSTQVAVTIGSLYQANDMPHGWLIPSDGYGCGYGEKNDGLFPHNITDLTSVIAQLHTLGFWSGLWTSTGMPYISEEVGTAGSRICKTDVGWIGAGYKYAFDGVTLCADGIEQYSPDRRFVWTVEGWAGTHRLAVMWTGDNSGSLEYVRWQVPSFIGAGFSAQAHVSGDIDGIFGGSPESQVREFQFKSMMSVLMVMSGWAANPDKQPWTWGEPYTTYNRAALKLKSQLTPYMYSLCRAAYETGVPPVRAMLLEFPSEEALYTDSNSTSYQFLSGPSILVAPVFEPGAVTRDNIRLPNGTTWVDWWDGTRLPGGQTVNGYDAPLSKLPMLVRGGAIIPLWPPMNYFNEKPADPMYLELWPSGESTFVLYEDDGVTREALPPTSVFTKTTIGVSAPVNYLTSKGSGNVSITVGAGQGTYTGQLSTRGWWLNVRSLSPPLQVMLAVGGGAAVPLPPAQSVAELEYSTSGWYHDTSLQLGLLMVKVPSTPPSSGFTVTLSNGPSFPHIGTETCDTPAHHQVEEQKFFFTADGKFTVGAAGGGDCLTAGLDKDPDSHTPALEVQGCDPSLDDRQMFVHTASNQLALKSDATSCLDQDTSVNRVIFYGCHDPSDPGNQAWTVEGATNHLVSGQNGLCMNVLPA